MNSKNSRRVCPDCEDELGHTAYVRHRDDTTGRICPSKNIWRASVANETLTGVAQLNRGCLFIWRASVASETVLGVDNAKLGICCYWRASVTIETLTGVTQLKIGDVCLFVCMDVHMSFCTLTVAFLC